MTTSRLSTTTTNYLSAHALVSLSLMPYYDKWSQLLLDNSMTFHLFFMVNHSSFSNHP